MLIGCDACKPHRFGLAWGMAKTLQVRGVPEQVHATLRARAATAGVALSEYVLRELIALAERPTVGEVLRRAEERAETVPVDDIVAAVRSGRDR
jgi:antitoxin FitA